MTLSIDAVYDLPSRRLGLANRAEGRDNQKYQPPRVQAALLPSSKDTGQVVFLANFASLLVSLRKMLK